MSSRSRTPIIVAVVIVVVAVVGLIAVLATRGGDDDATTGTTVAGSLADGYGNVTVTGDPLPQGEGDEDPSIGTAVPTIAGTDYTGAATAIEPGKDGPMMIVVMAHWCPHCNREVPLLVDWKKSGKVPDGLQVVGISTAVDASRPNFPPGEWIDKLGWDWPLIADDKDQDAALAVGTTGYPFLVFVDAKGNLLARVSGELPIETVQQLADATAATATG